MSTADVVVVRSFFFLYAAVDLFTPLFLAGLLLLALAPLAALLEESESQAAVPALSSVVKRLFVLYVVCVKGTALTKSCESRR